MTGKVYLVGAGCGAADLITLRGLELLRRCDAVAYDALLDPALLDAAPQADRYPVGKRSGQHSATQPEINALLVSLAQAGKTVVRLKGGDPYVFGRGGEEAQALLAAGVPFEVVPGISSAIAIPALAGIPVTHRGLSRSVHIVTAHTADTADGLPAYFDDLARLPGTLVFLMGLEKLERITARLLAAGKGSDTPAAVLSGGNAAHPATVRGTLSDIAARARAAGVRPPAVILVGGTAGMDLSPAAGGPLAGARVGLTGTDAVTGKLRAGLEGWGAETFPAVRAAVEALPLPEKLGALLDGSPRWLVFTSANGVEVFSRRLAEERIDRRRLASCRFAVIGPATGRAMERLGLYADLCPDIATTRSLGEALLGAVRPGEEICLLRSRRGTPELAELLWGAFPVRDIPLYDVAPDPQSVEAARPRLAGADYLTFSSAGGVEMFFQAHGAIPEGAVCVCIGPVTERALRARYSGPVLTAAEISAEGILTAILKEDRGRFESARSH